MVALLLREMDKKYQKLKFCFAIWAVIGVKFLNEYPACENMLGTWNDLWVTWSYDYGFIRRGLLGTVIKVGGRIANVEPPVAMMLYGWITVFIFTSLCIVIIYSIIMCEYHDYSIQIFIFIMLIVFFTTYGWDTRYSYYGSGDTWLIVSTFAAIFFIIKRRYFIALFFVILSMLIHEAYIFLYFNSVVIGLYIWYLKDRKKSELNYIGLFSVVSSILFIYLCFFSKAKDGITVEYILEQHKLYTGADLASYYQIIDSYLISKKNVLGNLYGIKNQYKVGILNLLFKLPIYLEIIRYWLRVVKDKSVIDKIRYLLIPIGFITTIPLFIMHVDYGRWFYSIFFYEITAGFLLNYIIADEDVIHANQATYMIIKKNIYYYIVLLLYFSSLGISKQNSIHIVYEKVIWLFDDLIVKMKI